MLGVVGTDLKGGMTSDKRIERDQSTLRSDVEIVRRPIHHRYAKLGDRAKQIVDHHLIFSLKSHTTGSRLTVTQKDIP